MPSRRTFLTGTAAAAVASALPVPARAMDPVKRAGPSRLRIGLAAYSMRQYLQAKPGTPGAMDLLGFVDWAATLDTDAVELTSYFFPEQVTRSYLNDLKRRCHVNGLDISGGAIRNNFTLPRRRRAGEVVQPSRHVARSLCGARRAGHSRVRRRAAQGRDRGAGHPERHRQPAARLRDGGDAAASSLASRTTTT